MIKRKITVCFIIISAAFFFKTPELFCQYLDLSHKTPSNAAIRSAVVPGWGQYFNGDKTRAGIVAGAEAALIVSSVIMYSKADSTYSDYERKGVPDDPLYDEYKSQKKTADILLGLAIAGWVYNIVDAYLFSPYTDSGYGDEEANLNLEINAGLDDIDVSYTWLRF